MHAVLTILNDDGVMVCEQHFNAMSPWTHKLNSPILVPCMVGLARAGTYEFFGFQYQPTLRLTGKVGGF